MVVKTFNSKKYGKITVTLSRKSKSNNFVVDKAVSLDEAWLIQDALGYHPHGYDLYLFNGNSWRCQASCD